MSFGYQRHLQFGFELCHHTGNHDHAGIRELARLTPGETSPGQPAQLLAENPSAHILGLLNPYGKTLKPQTAKPETTPKPNKPKPLTLKSKTLKIPKLPQNPLQPQTLNP